MLGHVVVLKIKRLHISIAASQPKLEVSWEERFRASFLKKVRLLGVIIGVAIAETFKVAIVTPVGGGNVCTEAQPPPVEVLNRTAL